MKTLVVFSFLTALTVQAQTGATIALTNPGTNALVSNALTGMLVKSNDYVSVLLYVAPDGTTSEEAFMALPPPAPVSGGHYNGGTRMVLSAQPGAPVMIQVRAFETAYGNSYEQAVAAPPANGRRALVGKSRMGRVILGGTPPIGGPPFIPPNTSFLGPIVVDVVGGGPLIAVGDLVVAEGSNGTAQANFKINLISPQADPVSVEFSTQDGSALASQDYVATNGVVTFAPGETSKTVPVTLTPDAPAEPDENFYLVLSNATNGSIVRSPGACIITEVRITKLTVDTSISFNTVAGRRYALEKTMNFIDWIGVAGATNLVGTGNIMTAVDRESGCQSFTLYRARLIEE